jgi:hypothetical protein
MKSKFVRLGALALLTLGLGTVHAQMPPGGYGGEPGGPAPIMGGPAPIMNVSAPLTSSPRPAPSLSQWIVGTEPDCCGPLGDRTPLETEVYFRSGVSFPFGDGQLAKAIHAGWTIGGGYRALFFDYGDRAAWTVDLGLTNTYNGSSDGVVPVPVMNFQVRGPANTGMITVPRQIVTPSALNRTFVNLGLGREWYLFGAPNNTRNDEGGRWRIGFDAGARYGTAKCEFREIPHFTDVIAGAFVSLHSDVEFSCGCCTFFAGVRTEFDYTWSDILQIQNNSDRLGFNLLANVGVRF